MSARDAGIEQVASYYAGKLREHGANAAGVDWNSEASQRVRFDQLLRIADRGTGGSLNDYGCGYGALRDHLTERGGDWTYSGYDISAEMIAAAQERSTVATDRFTDSHGDIEPADYTVASGIFNVRLDASDEDWLAHVLDTLGRMRELSTRGFAFNMLTSWSDPDRMRPDLFYADPAAILDHCLREYSRRVAILHDYELYEFTVLVRIDGSR